MNQTYSGSCHCGNVRFRASVDLTESMVCDCSICAMKAAIINRVSDADFEMLTSLDQLSVYRFNKGIAKHYFCKTCGICPFHRPRTRPDLWGVNVRCLKDVDLDELTPRQVRGSKLD